MNRPYGRRSAQCASRAARSGGFRPVVVRPRMRKLKIVLECLGPLSFLTPFRMVVPASTLTLFGPHASSNVRFAPEWPLATLNAQCGLLVTLFLKLPNLRLCTPITKALGLERELPFAIEKFVGDRFHPGGIFEHHAVGSLEIEKAGRRGRMPSRTECYRDAPLFQEMIGAHHVVAGLDLMVDVLDSDVVGWKQRDRMVYLINTQQRGIADTIGDAGVANGGPELLITDDIG